MEKTAFLISKGVDINKSLELFGDIQTYDDTIGEFLVGITNKLAKLNNYKDNKDMRNYAIYVHSLKSDAKTFGFTELANIAFEHEQNQREAIRIIVEQERQNYNNKSWFGKAIAKLRGRTFAKMRNEIEDYATRKVENMSPESLKRFIENNSEQKGRSR